MPQPQPMILNGPVIRAGESLSEPLDVSAGAVVRLFTPPEWTPANVTFQMSSDGTRYGDAIHPDGTELMMSLTPGTVLPASRLTEFLDAATWVKVRSGSRDYPIPQEAERVFQVALS